MVAETTERDARRDAGAAGGTAAAGAVTPVDAILFAAFENGMLGDDAAKFEDADQIGQLLDLDYPPGAIGHAVIVAADGDEAVMADPALELEHGIEPVRGQRLQLGLLGGERLGDDALGGAMHTGIAHGHWQRYRASRPAGG